MHRLSFHSPFCAFYFFALLKNLFREECLKIYYFCEKIITRWKLFFLQRLTVIHQ